MAYDKSRVNAHLKLYDLRLADLEAGEPGYYFKVVQGDEVFTVWVTDLDTAPVERNPEPLSDTDFRLQ